MAKRVITPIGTFAFVNAFKPRKDDNGNDRYSIAIFWSPEDNADLTDIRKAILAAAQEKWGDKAEQMLRTGKLKNPLRQEVEPEYYPAGAFYINARTSDQPGVIDHAKNVITDPKALYSGAKGRLSISFYAFDKEGNRGVAAGLNNIQKVGDGKRIDGRKAAQDEFDAVEAVSAGVGDLSDLE